MPATTTPSVSSLLEAVAEINRLLAAQGLPGGEFETPPAPRTSKFEDKVIVRVDERGVGINAAGAYVARKKAIDPRGLYAAWADARKIAKATGSPPRPQVAPAPQAAPAPTPQAAANPSLDELVAMFGAAYPEALTALRAIWTAKAADSSCKGFVHVLMGYRK